MPDRKLQYWYDWEIYGPDGQILENFKRPGPAIEKDRLEDSNYLRNLIKENPNQALMNKHVRYRIVMLRQKAFKNEAASESLEQVCKAIMGDGRRRKNQDKLNDLRAMILNDIEFFRTIQNRISDENVGVDQTIEDFLIEGTSTIEAQDRRRNELSNYKNVYYAYRRIYNKLSPNITTNEIFRFFEEAAEYIDDTNVTVDVDPDGRLLTFVKVNTWYVEGSDMTEDSHI